MKGVVSTFVYYPTHLNRKAAKIIQKSDEIFLLKHPLTLSSVPEQINKGTRYFEELSEKHKKENEKRENSPKLFVSVFDALKYDSNVWLDSNRLSDASSVYGDD
jgi:hypothetical protein